MSVLGITAEYNPFHDGHLYHLEEARRLTGARAVVVCMSGNFVQRGEPAVYDKWARAETAVRKGADLVLELPTYFALNSAETFAQGAVSLFRNIGIVDVISYGSETANEELQAALGEFLAEEPERYRALLRQSLDAGRSFASSREDAIRTLFGEETAELLTKPNDILGIEYRKAAKRLNFNVSFLPILRKGESHLVTSSVIRRSMRDMAAERRLFDLVAYNLIMSTDGALEKCPAGGEGLGNRVRNLLNDCETLDELLLMANSGRYPSARIRRLVIQSLLGMEKSRAEGPLYARVLAFNDRGASLIREIKDKGLSRIPVLTNINKEAEELAASSRDPAAFRSMLNLDIRAGEIRNLIFNLNRYANSEYRMAPFRDLKGE